MNQYGKIFYVRLLIGEYKLISVNIKYLEDDITIKFLLIRQKDCKIRLFGPPFPGHLRAVITLSPLVLPFIRRLIPFQVFVILLIFI